jgi:hypothetical protein
VRGVGRLGRGLFAEACDAPLTLIPLPPPFYPTPLFPAQTAYGIDTFSDMLELRDMLPAASDDEEGGEEISGVADGEGAGKRGGGGGASAPAPRATPGGGLQVSGRALRAIAPRSAAFLKKFRALNEALVGVLEDYNLVSFRTVSCREEPSMRELLEEADRAVGFIPTAPLI